jgi:hypothetical protein
LFSKKKQCYGSGSGRIGTSLPDPDPFKSLTTECKAKLRKFQYNIQNIEINDTADADEKDTMLINTAVNKSQASVKLGVGSGSGSASNGKLDPDPHRHQIDADPQHWKNVS